MNKPNGYDEARASGEYTPVELGGHYAVIKQVSETQSSTGNDMIVVLFDFAKPDKQINHFTKQFTSDDRPYKKWPFPGTKYIMVHDYEDPSKTSRAFKTFCTCFERSNGCEIQWNGNSWGQQFKGKKIGVVFGEEESSYEGKISMRRVPKWFCRYDTVPDQTIPKPKYLNGKSPAASTASAAAAPTTGADGFMNIPEGQEEDIPF